MTKKRIIKSDCDYMQPFDSEVSIPSSLGPVSESNDLSPSMEAAPEVEGPTLIKSDSSDLDRLS